VTKTFSPGKRVNIWTAAIVVFLLPFRLTAAEHDHRITLSDISLDTVLEHALEAAPELILADSAQLQADSFTYLGSRWINGSPSLETTFIDDAMGSDVGLREMEAGVSINLWRPGERQSAQALGNAYRLRSETWQAWFEWMVAGRVRDSLANLESADLALQRAEQAEADAEALFEMATTLKETGLISDMDLYQVESLWLNARKKTVASETVLVDAEREYQVLTQGLDTRPDTPLREEQSSVALIDSQHPAMALLQSDLNINMAEIETAKRQAKGSPTMRMGVRRERGGFSQPYIDSLGVSISIPLNSKRMIDASTADARAARNDAELTVINQHRLLTSQLHEIEHRLSSFKTEIPLAERENELGERRRKMAEIAYSNGEIDSTQVIQAIQQAQQSAYAYQRVLMEQQHLISQYNQIVGVIP
tara:strand:+ start:5392 stop:6654 length:1263 start_codon:yes stop_codon:yes gene_type:complete